MQNQDFMGFLKTQTMVQPKKPLKIDKTDLVNSLKQYEEYYNETLQKPKPQDPMELSFKKTTRDVELKQQRQLQQLHQKLMQSKQEAVELNESNSQLYKEIKQQKHLIRSMQRDKAQFEKSKKEWDIKLVKMEEKYALNQQIADNVKVVMNIIDEDIEKQAIIVAKQEQRNKQ